MYISLLIDFFTFFLYMILLVSIWFIFSNDILYFLRKNFHNSRFRGIIKKDRQIYVFGHISQIFEVVFGKKFNHLSQSFCFFSLFTFSVCFLLFSRSLSFIVSLVASIFFALVPYFYLRLRLHTHRVNISHEAEKLVTELLNQYRINYFNMHEAIDRSIKYLENAPNSKKHLWRLSMSLKEYKSDDELNDILNNFYFGINTLWAQMLVHNIYLAISDNVNVSPGLEDILSQLKDAKSQVEYYKRLNTEGFTIYRVFSPGFPSVAIPVLLSTISLNLRAISFLAAYATWARISPSSFSVSERDLSFLARASTPSYSLP